jgi:hypothetical protein
VETIMSDPATHVAERPPPAVWRRLFIAAGVFVVMLMVLAAIHYSLQRSRDNEALQEALAELDETDPGWRLEDIELARPSITDEQNSASVVLAVSGLLPPTGFKQMPVMRLLSRRGPELLDTKQMALLGGEMTAAHAGIMQARKLMDLPTGRFPSDYYRAAALCMQHLQAIRAVVNALLFDALFMAQTGKATESLRSCRAIFNAARSLDDEPGHISQGARCIDVTSAAQAVERTLSLAEPAPAELASLQELVQVEEAHPGLLVSHRGKRAMAHDWLDGLLQGAIQVENLFSNDDPRLWWRVRYAKLTIRDGVRQHYPHLLRLHNRAIEIARLPLHEQASAENDLKREIVLLSPKSMFFAHSWPDVIVIGPMFREKVACLRCLVVLLALERYRQQKGTWPTTLEELTPKLLKAVPLDPFIGKPLRYKRLHNRVIVYSVGPDTIDNGGIIDGAMLPVTHGRDLGFRLWDVKHRRQPPPPEKAP